MSRMIGAIISFEDRERVRRHTSFYEITNRFYAGISFNPITGQPDK